MIRQSPRLLLRSSPCLRTTLTRRFLSTAPPARKSRSWKSYTARLALAFGAVYYYNTSQLFAEEPPFSIPPPQSPTDETSLQTLESLAIKNRKPPPPTPQLAAAHSSQNATSEALAPSHPPEKVNPNPMPSTPEDLEATEEEASQEGAFNEETGEINWDCPCLGGMAHGPCGEQFRAAFSCFVYSKDEPKGMDCIPKFKNMQDCFREHPDVYGAELADDDEEGQEIEDAQGGAPASAPVSVEGGEVPTAATAAEPAQAPSPALQSPPSTSSPTSADVTQQGSADESKVLVPKAAHDATNANTEK